MMITDEEARKVAAEWSGEGGEILAVADGGKWCRQPLTDQIRAVVARYRATEFPWSTTPQESELYPLMRWAIYGAPGSPGYGRRSLRSCLTESSGDGDVWGWGMNVGGGLCDVLTHTGNGDRIPDAMGYYAGLFGPDVESYPAESILTGFESGEYSVDDMAYYCRVMSRYLDLCKRAGRDY